jgi:hypothetical protein
MSSPDVLVMKGGDDYVEAAPFEAKACASMRRRRIFERLIARYTDVHAVAKGGPA